MEFLIDDDELKYKVKQAFEDFFKKKTTADQCTEETLAHLHKAFLATEGNTMDSSELHNAFDNILHIKLSVEEFQDLYTKIDTRKKKEITWDDFISYLLVEFQKNDRSLQWQMLELPITDLPKVFRTRHRTPVCRIAFYPELLQDRTGGFQKGCYITASRDGVINYWSLDFEYERTVQSTNPFLKVQPTAVTDMIVMSDIQVICTSSTERDLRFYDTVAKKFDLRVMIFSLDYAVVCMSYYFSTNITEDSYIILGDTSGSIILMSFSPIEKGPFKQQPECDTTFLRYGAVVRNEFEGLKVVEIKNIHSDWVNQVAYYGSLRAFLSCSRCSDCSLLFSDPTGIRIHYVFKIPMGISCFDLCEETQMLVTGGPDCIVRTWNPFVPKRPSNTFQGHQEGISAVIIQDAGKRIYSLSKDRCIKVWNVATQNCIQTYNGLQNELSENLPMVFIYNTLTHYLVIANMVITIVVLEKVINQENSDGYTHTKAVSCVLYNHLYKLIITTGLDSCIIVWNPWLGRRLYLVTNAHSVQMYGQYVTVEITAATFDDSEQLLITGARDGSLKIWNFNTGTCLRNMSIDDQCEVTSLVWIENRILCTGWNRRVTEFATSEFNVYKKNWEIRHIDDVILSAVRYPQALATVSYNGEIILWRLETGQPYRRYNVSNATGRFNIVYKKERESIQKSPRKTSMRQESTSEEESEEVTDICPHQQSAMNMSRVVTVRAMLFLTSRKPGPNVGTLLVSLESGLVQVWTHHPGGGFLGAFSVIHFTRDCAMSLATDPENTYLITGHCVGYIKVWYLANYMIPDPPKIPMPKLKLEFPFLWHTKIKGRAKRAVRNQPLPLLLSSYRGHTKAITSLQIIPEARIIISGSSDHTVRLWTLGGRYISTLGTFREWVPILPNVPISQYFKVHRLPPDIKRTASFTTLKVLQGGYDARESKGIVEDLDYYKELSEDEKRVLYGERCTSPILGRSYKLPEAESYKDQPVLDNSLAYIPVYTHLLTHTLKHVELKLPTSSRGQKVEFL